MSDWQEKMRAPDRTLDSERARAKLKEHLSRLPSHWVSVEESDALGPRVVLVHSPSFNGIDYTPARWERKEKVDGKKGEFWFEQVERSRAIKRPDSPPRE